ncbi:MAG: helix-turn-helix transcriptional regulator [Bosea sp.]|nr:helix-turn-helix transcriptional regulator [Bosea sp. (in: a-proteobacteria)]
MTNDDEAALAERLKEAVAQAGGVRVVARISGVPERTLTRYLGGGSEPPALTLGRIARAVDVSLDWLVGKGDRATTSRSAQPDMAGGDHADSDTVLIPLMSAVGSAGTGIQNHDVEVLRRLPFSRQLLQRLGVRVQSAQFIQHSGDSMFPTLQDGGVSLVDTSRTRASDGKIYALMIGDDLVIKRLQLGVKGLTLISDNADKYPPETLSGYDLDQVKIMGQVFWSGGVV